MSYSALFTSGLSLASQPRMEPEVQAASRPPSLQINVHPGTPARPRLRKRRSSLTIATSPISAVKSPLRSANEALRVALRSPREGTFLETLQNSGKPRTVRRKTVSYVPPPLPAPTSPLPTLPPAYLGVPRPALLPSAPPSPAESPYPSSPVTSEFSAPWVRAPNPSRKSSSILPTLGRSRSSSASGRGPLAPSPYAGNKPTADLDMGIVEEKDASAPVWVDEDELMKENDSEA